jgi:excisionase family DNA binding protein
MLIIKIKYYIIENGLQNKGFMYQGDIMEKEILNMEEAAEFFSVSVKTFIKILKEEKVPGRKIGREWRFSRTALIEWLSSGSSMDYSESDTNTKDYYDRVAHDWEKIREGFYDESIAETMLQKCNIQKSFRVLDLGCGDGYLTRAVAPLSDTVIGVDISEEMIKELKLQSEKANIKNIIAIKSDGRNLHSLDDEEVDFICSNMYLHNLEETN